MKLNSYFKSIIDSDRQAVVICDLNHIIIYMNPAAVNRYSKRGGNKLVGKSLLDCHNKQSCDMIEKIIAWFKSDEQNNCIYTFHNDKENADVYMIALRDDSKQLIGYYEKHESRIVETMSMYDFK